LLLAAVLAICTVLTTRKETVEVAGLEALEQALL
jgi:hypothetical protein